MSRRKVIYPKVLAKLVEVRFTTKEIAKMFGVDRRTIQRARRDIENEANVQNND